MAAERCDVYFGNMIVQRTESGVFREAVSVSSHFIVTKRGTTREKWRLLRS